MSKISIDFKTGTLKTKPEYIVGIDLGTTNSLIACVINGKPVVLPVGNDSSTLIPSILHFIDEKNALFGTEGKTASYSNPKNTLLSFKRLMGKTYQDIDQLKGYNSYSIAGGAKNELVQFEIEHGKFSAFELSSMLLENIKVRAENYLKAEVSKAVITVPAYFTDSQRQATREAGIKAGFNVLRIINEPTAASMAYGIGLTENTTKQVIVYDFGGGTFDVSVLRIENGIFDVLATKGDNFLGGDDIDFAIVDFWINKYNLNLKPDEIKSLKSIAETCKINLSEHEVVKQNFNQTELSLSREEFDLTSFEIIHKTIACSKDALKESGLSKEEIDEVILVGGSSRLLKVKSALKETFQKPLNDFLNPDEVVALGAAIQADILAGNRKDILLLDITPLSLGIETIGGLMDVIVPRNSKIPLRLARNYTTSKDGQKKLKISVYQGEREMVEDNIKLAEFILNDLPPMAAGLPKIEITFNIDADGILSVKAKELRSAIEQNIEIKTANNFDEKTIGEHLKESITFAQKDHEKKSLIEAVNEANYIITNAQKFLKQNKDLLSDKETSILHNQLNTLTECIRTKQKEEINNAILSFNQSTAEIAHRIMELQFNKTLGGSSIDSI